VDENATGSPGSHPHADQRNWKPAKTFEEYRHNCDEGLEQWSERRAATLLGISRTELWRWKLMAELPEDLFEQLLVTFPRPTTKALADVALVLRGKAREERECCPNCGWTLRVREPVSQAVAALLMEARCG